MSTGEARRAILFEDSIWSGIRICALLLERGLAVIWSNKILEIQEEGILCGCLDPTTAQSNGEFFIRFDEDKCAVVILDGQLHPTSKLHGWDLSPERIAQACIFISGNANDAMGARLGDTITHFSTSHKPCRPDLFMLDLERFLIQLGLLPPAEAKTLTNF